MKKLCLALPLIALFGCDAQIDHAQHKTEVSYLQMSGKLGNMPGTLDLAEGGITGETRQTMENISATLQQFGSSLDDVVKCTVFLADIAEWGAMNEVYRTYFKNPPARSALGASGLALNARVEIECIAITE